MRYLFALAVGAVTFWSFTVPDAIGFQYPELARIFLWHFPCPMIATVLLFMGAWFSYRYNVTKDLTWDIRAVASMEICYLFCILTMLTGILFSQAQWGAWWQNDPRQTSFLLVLLIYAAYFALRGALSDEQRRATNSAVYALAALLPVLFLIFVFPRLPQIQSFHPSDSVMSGKIKGQYAYAVTSICAIFTVLTVWIYRMRVTAGLLEYASENTQNGYLDSDGGDSADSRVVRPVRIPRES